MKHKSGGRMFTQYYQNNLLLKENLKAIESSLNKINEELKESNKRSFIIFGAGIGFAGLAIALALSITSPAWTSIKTHPSQYSFILMALSLGIMFWCILKILSNYNKTIAVVGTIFLFLGPLGYTLSNFWWNNPFINIAAILVFLVGLCILPLSVRHRDKSEAE